MAWRGHLHLVRQEGCEADGRSGRIGAIVGVENQIADAISPTLISLARYTHASSANTLPFAIARASLPRLTWRILTSYRTRLMSGFMSPWNFTSPTPTARPLPGEP